MKVNWIEIENIKSYKAAVKIQLNNDYNFIVGPNGSGKTTALQALASTLLTVVPKVKTTSSSNGNDPVQKFSIQVEQTPIQLKPNYLNQLGLRRITIEISLEDSFEGFLNEIKSYRRLFGENIDDIKNRFHSTEGLLDTIDSLVANLELFDSYVFQFDFEVTPNVLMLKSESRESKIAVVDALIAIENYRTIYEYLLRKGLVEDAVERGFNLIFLGADRAINFSGQVGLSKGSFDELFNNSSRNQNVTLQNYIYSASSFDYISQTLLKIVEQISTMRWQKQTTQTDALTKIPELVEIKAALEDILGYELRISEPVTQFDNFIFTFFDGEIEINFEDLSSGEKSLIYFIFTLANPDIKNSFILVDEAELHLHGNMQDKVLRMIFGRSELNNQHFITTHSPKMINSLTISHILRFYKENSQTKYINFKTEAKLGTDYDIIRLVNSQNNEKVFFADKVVLVEGIKDRILLSNVLLKMNETDQIIEVIEVGGKKNFDLYKNYLEEIKVPVFVFADLDHLYDLKKSELTSLLVTNDSKADEIIKDKNSSDRKSLVANLEEFLDSGDKTSTKAILDHIRVRGTTLKQNLSQEEKTLTASLVDELNRDNVFFPSKAILIDPGKYTGEIEDFLKQVPKGQSSSEAIKNLVEYVSNDDFLKDMCANCPEELFRELVCFTLGVIYGDDSNADGVISDLGSTP